ncbi:ABC transporter ATP-binding protein/permease [Streptomyces sp. NBC_01142]|uniref:ABC transporter ATP-binding protein n=1 Tax=Streptomyces sp. NBC_01142 TaxID=2975865 RepID=UPI00224D82AF|nr:ABC transporter ATP-binding protein [Streptomyces sp. NBC_01142]MCX4818405.1 ABC transporter ATP-binding protein/permease [Streptomyces sp. NBC_01142]
MLVVGGLLSLVGSGAGLAMPMMAKYTVDAFADGRSPARPLTALVLVVLVGAVLAAGGRYLMARTGEAVVLHARRQLVGRMLRLRVAAVDRLTPGDLLSRVTGDTTLLHTVLSRSIVEAASGLLMLVGTVVLMAVVDLVLLGVTFGVMILCGALLALLMPRIQRAQLQAQEAVGAMGSLLDRVLQAFRTVKASGAEERETAVVVEAAQQAHDRGVTVARWTSVSEVAVFLSMQLAFLAVLGVGGARAVSGAMEVSSLIAFLLYVFALMAPLSQLTDGWTGLNTGLAAVRRIEEIESLPGETPGGAAGESPGKAAGKAPGETPGEALRPESSPVGVAFQDVHFGYDDERAPAHRSVTFEVPAGGLTALVGPSGAGKSTVFALLERFYDHDVGTVTVGGRDIRDWPLGELRAALAYVEQDAPVLAGTLRDNLLLAAPRATREDVRHAVSRTRLDDLVARLPEGLDTQVGHRGVMLSGGERQRIAIARALLRKPRLLLLDEVTSQLDAVNEEALREVILELAADTTVLVIAHRLSTVVRADRIVVMQDGRVRATGRHDDLVESDTLYAELAATQLAAAPSR